MPEYKRWYDFDPLLLEVVNLLKNYQTELRSHAEVFLKKIEEKVSRDAMDRFYNMVKPEKGLRWYDKDPVISMTVELLRVIPPDVQRQCAEHFIKSLHDMGIEYHSAVLEAEGISIDGNQSNDLVKADAEPAETKEETPSNAEKESAESEDKTDSIVDAE